MNFLLYSGGLDGFVILHSLLELQREKALPPGELIALTFDYGQRAGQMEIEAAITECRRLGVTQRIIGIHHLFSEQASALISGAALPSDHYAAPSQKVTEVAGRNAVLLTIAMSYAYSEALKAGGHARVYSGINWDPDQPGNSIYPDCRPGFLRAMETTFYHATEGRVMLKTPLEGFTKPEILRYGQEAGLEPFDFARAYSCYAGGEKPCGKCAACTKRAAAFAAMGWVDPASLP